MKKETIIDNNYLEKIKEALIYISNNSIDIDKVERTINIFKGVSFDYNNDSRASAQACIEIDNDELKSIIRINPNRPFQDDTHRNHLINHELLHLLNLDIDKAPLKVDENWLNNNRRYLTNFTKGFSFIDLNEMMTEYYAIQVSKYLGENIPDINRHFKLTINNEPQTNINVMNNVYGYCCYGEMLNMGKILNTMYRKELMDDYFNKNNFYESVSYLKDEISYKGENLKLFEVLRNSLSDLNEYFKENGRMDLDILKEVNDALGNIYLKYIENENLTIEQFDKLQEDFLKSSYNLSSNKKELLEAFGIVREYDRGYFVCLGDNILEKANEIFQEKINEKKIEAKEFLEDFSVEDIKYVLNLEIDDVMIPSEIIKNEYLVSMIIDEGCPEIINYVDNENIKNSDIVQDSLEKYNDFSL